MLRILRLLLNVAAVLSLLVALLLSAATIASVARLLGPWWLGGSTSPVGVLVANGTLAFAYHKRVMASVPFGVLAIAFALLPSPWAIIQYRREHRGRARGFPVEVSRHDKAIEPAADRRPKAAGGEAIQAASGQSDPQG